MLRVGLTGGLGSGKSTVGAMLATHGAHLLQADEIGRELMQPGQPVYAAIVHHFGPPVLLPDGALNRRELARLAFTDGRVEELNAIVHPAVIARQAELAAEIAHRDPSAVVVVESALIFETSHGGPGGWRSRFDRIILVAAPEDLKIARFISRAAKQRSLDDTQPDPQTADLTAEARRRLASQIDDNAKAPLSDFVLHNTGSLDDLRAQVDQLWPALIHPTTPSPTPA